MTSPDNWQDAMDTRGPRPFGEVSCEEEIGRYGNRYKEFYFDHAPFNRAVIDPHRYLIVGRRGSGKTSLLQAFRFPDSGVEAIVYDDEDVSEFYRDIYSIIRQGGYQPATILIPQIARVWEVIVWGSLFKRFCDTSPVVAEAWRLASDEHSFLESLGFFLRGVVSKHVSEDTELMERCLRLIRREARLCQEDATVIMEEPRRFLSHPKIKAAREELCRRFQEKPVVLAFDSLEHNELNDEGMMTILAAQVTCATSMNNRYADSGLYMKVFVTDEIYPHLYEKHITNPIKYMRNPVLLHWSPKDLIRLISWRLCRYIQQQGGKDHGRGVDWERFADVRDKVWNQHFGPETTNGYDQPEGTFPYLLRHTQMKPRELIFICNKLARMAHRGKWKFDFQPKYFLTATRMSTRELAQQIINSYSKIYPNLSALVESLASQPMIFPGSKLDALAHRTASSWQPAGLDYSPLMFRVALCEAGIIGRLRRHDPRTNIVEADFEYFMQDRLVVNEKDQVVIHPLFFELLNIDTSRQLIVFPFPDRDEYRRMMEAES